MTENKEIIERLKHFAYADSVRPYDGLFEDLRTAIEALEEIQEYRAIGTVEECREAVEKMKPKKPIDRCMFKECPVCGNVEIEHCNHCTDCGQALDWSDIPEKENT